MTIYMFPHTDKPLYGLTTGNAYEPIAAFSWRANGAYFSLYGLAEAEPDGVTDVRPFKAGDTISSEEDFEALPNGTILRDGGGAWEKVNGCFFSAGDESPSNSSELADDNMLTILWLPETGDRA